MSQEVYLLYDEDSDSTEAYMVGTEDKNELARHIESFMDEHDTQECHYIRLADMKKAGIKVVFETT